MAAGGAERPLSTWSGWCTQKTRCKPACSCATPTASSWRLSPTRFGSRVSTGSGDGDAHRRRWLTHGRLGGGSALCVHALSLSRSAQNRSLFEYTCLCALQRLSKCMLPPLTAVRELLSCTPLWLATGACQHRSCSSSPSPLTGRTSRLLLQRQLRWRPAAAPAVLPVTAASTHTLLQPVRPPLLMGTRSIRWVGGWALTSVAVIASKVGQLTQAGRGNDQAGMGSRASPHRAGTSGRQTRVRV